MHFYQDTSNFRAPYDNIAVSGMGASVVQGPPAPDPLAHPGLEKHPNGLWYFTPDSAGKIIDSLVHFKAIPGTVDPSGETVLITAWTEAEAAAPELKALREQMNARAWYDAQVKAGKMVSAPAMLVTLEQGQMVLGSVDPANTAVLQYLATSGASRINPVLYDPRLGDRSATAGIGLGTGLLIAGVAIGGIYGISRYMKKRK